MSASDHVESHNRNHTCNHTPEQERQAAVTALVALITSGAAEMARDSVSGSAEAHRTHKMALTVGINALTQLGITDDEIGFATLQVVTGIFR